METQLYASWFAPSSSQGINVTLSSDNNGKKEFEKYSLIPSIKARRMWKSSRMGLGQNDIHEHLLFNSFAHTRQCMWLVQIDSNWVTNLPWIHL